MGVWDAARLRGLSGGQEQLSLPKNPRSDLSEVLLMKPRQGHGGTVPKRSQWSHMTGESLWETSQDPSLGR